MKIKILFYFDFMGQMSDFGDKTPRDVIHLVHTLESNGLYKKD